MMARITFKKCKIFTSRDIKPKSILEIAIFHSWKRFLLKLSFKTQQKCIKMLTFCPFFYFRANNFFLKVSILPNYPFVNFNPNQFDVWEGPSGGGEGSWSPPPPILALEPNSAKISCFPVTLHQFQLIWPFSKYFFNNSRKNNENWKTTENFLKISEIFEICNFSAISTCNTSKYRIFHIEFIFKQKKYDFLKIFLLKKLYFFDFFFKIYTEQLSSIAIF